jgi:hypothetical protein
MGLMDVLGRYAQSQEGIPPQAHADFERVAQEAPPEMLSDGLAGAFRSDATPPFEKMVGQLFGNSDPHQRAGLLNEILGSVAHGGGGGLGGALSGGVLGGLLRHAAAGRTISPQDAQDVSAADVEDAAREAARANPSIIDRVSRFYAQHPQLVQGLGQAALAVAMSNMARRRNV